MKYATIALKIIAILMGVVFVPTDAVSANLSMEREVIIQDDPGLTIHPNVISRSGDDFIVAGSISGKQQAWAVKVDSKGKVLWRYAFGIRDQLSLGYSAEFSGAASMPDGSTYLCGYLPTAGDNYQPALLTHLDEEGHVITEQLAKPQNSPEHGLSYLDDCVHFGNGIALLGHVVQYPSEKPAYFYWVRVLDKTGHIQWEKLLPSSFDSLNGLGPLVLKNDSSLVFSGSSFNKGTEIFRISKDGELTAQAKLSGEYRFFRSLTPQSRLQMYGNESSGPFKKITLNKELQINTEITAPRRFEFGPYIAYQTPDDAIVMFGSWLGNASHPRQQVMYVDATLQSDESIDLHRSGYADYAFIKAAAPTGREGEYVAARPLLEREGGDVPLGQLGNLLIPGTVKYHAIGAILNFIQVR